MCLKRSDKSAWRPPPTLKTCVSCTQNHRFHKCHQTLKSNEIDTKSGAFGAYFGTGSMELVSLADVKVM